MQTNGLTQTESKGQIPTDLRKAWDGNERISTPLTQTQKENERLRTENMELKERLEAMTNNFRVRTVRLRKILKTDAKRSQET